LRPITWARLIFNEVTYWTVGHVPESYHGTAAYLWSELGGFSRAIKHCKKYLAITESDYIFTLLGFCYGQRGDLERAADAYRSVGNLYEDPLVALGLAEVELAAGNTDEAKKIVATVGAGRGTYSGQVESSLTHLEEKLFRPTTDTMGD